MNILLIHAAYGFLGGLARGLLGFYKSYRTVKKIRFKPYYLLITLLLSALIGAFVAVLLITDYRVSILAGYVGIDLLENILKIYKRQQSL